MQRRSNENCKCAQRFCLTIGVHPMLLGQMWDTNHLFLSDFRPASANRVVLKLQSNSELRTASALSFFSWFTSASPGSVLPPVFLESLSRKLWAVNKLCQLLQKSWILRLARPGRLNHLRGQASGPYATCTARYQMSPRLLSLQSDCRCYCRRCETRYALDGESPGPCSPASRTIGHRGGAPRKM